MPSPKHRVSSLVAIAHFGLRSFLLGSLFLSNKTDRLGEQGMFPKRCCMPATRLASSPFAESFPCSLAHPLFSIPPCLLSSPTRVISQSVSTHRLPSLFCNAGYSKGGITNCLSHPNRREESKTIRELGRQSGHPPRRETTAFPLSHRWMGPSCIPKVFSCLVFP